MSQTLQNYLARATETAVANLETALLRLPEDKRNWQPAQSSRSALDQVAEVAILNGVTAHVITQKQFPAHFDFTIYGQDKAKFAAGEWSELKALLVKNTSLAVEAMRAIGDDELADTVQMPWGPMTVEQLIAYPSWNAGYHEGQINYIASILGCLE